MVSPEADGWGDRTGQAERVRREAEAAGKASRQRERKVWGGVGGRQSPRWGRGEQGLVPGSRSSD